MRQNILQYFASIQSMFIDGNKEMFEHLGFEKQLRQYNPVSIIIASFIFFNITPYLRAIVFYLISNLNSIHKIKLLIIRFAMNFSYVKNYITKTRKDIKELINKKVNKNLFKQFKFNDEPSDKSDIIKNFEEIAKAESDKFKDNKITGAIYYKLDEVLSIAQEVSVLFSYSDLNSPNVFPAARHIEAKCIDIGNEFFKDDNNESVGVITTGGTESIMSAVLAYKNLAFEKGITEPELVCSIYTHAAFQKACDTFQVKYIMIEPDKYSHKIDIKKMKSAINSNTICVVGSYPNFPNGVCDDIDIMGQICEENNVPLHVDACLGGMLVAFMKEAGIKGLPKLDFNQKGITSISCDYHKYGQCPKGVSLLLYKNKNYRKYQYFKIDKLNGPCLTPGLMGSRNACFIAASLSILIYNGRKFYVEQTRLIHSEVIRLTKFTKDHLPLIQVVGEPKICVICWTGGKIREIYTKMLEKHWDISYIAIPIGFHIAITSANLPNILNKRLENDLKDSYDFVINNPSYKTSEAVKMYGMSSEVPQEIAKNNLDILVDNLLE